MAVLENMQPTIEPSANCSEFPNNSDTICRQAAIDAMANYFARWAEYTAWSKTVEAMVETAQEAVREVLTELPSAQPEGKDTNVPSTDLISRQAAIDALDMLCQEHRYKIPGKWETYSQYNEAWQDALDRAEGAIGNLPSAQSEQSEITDEQAITHLQSSGWMQNHDKEMYEFGLRERLNDDSGSYDSLIPCEDTISRQAVLSYIDRIMHQGTGKQKSFEFIRKHVEMMPSAQPEILACGKGELNVPDTNVGDLISRQALLRQIDIDADDEYGYYGDTWKFIDTIKKLPPAQPDRSLWFRIGEICVDESKGFISPGRAVEKIRKLLREAERRERK